MSGKIMGLVYDLDLPPNKQAVLLAMADHADHWGNGAYPAIGRIAWKTGYSKRHVIRIMKALVDDGILVVQKRIEGKPITYRINLKAGTLKDDYVPKKSRKAKGNQCQNVTPDTPCQNVTSDIAMSPPGVTSGSHGGGDIMVSPKPSVNRPLEPSEKKEKDSAAVATGFFDDIQMDNPPVPDTFVHGRKARRSPILDSIFEKLETIEVKPPARSAFEDFIENVLNVEDMDESAAAEREVIPATRPQPPKPPLAPDPVPVPPDNPPPAPAAPAKNALQEAVCFTFKCGYGAWAGKLGNFLTGQANTKTKGTKWDTFKVDDPSMTPQEIVAFGLWYRAVEKYKEQDKPPATPETLKDRIDEFRGASNYNTAMTRAEKKLKDLLGIIDPPPPEEEYVDPAIVEAALAELHDELRKCVR